MSKQNVAQVGKNYLITTNDFFIAPDGNYYKGVFGEINGVFTDKDSLGIETNNRSTNWYVSIGNMLVAGCQVFYVIKTDNVDFNNYTREIEYEGKIQSSTANQSHIYNANVENTNIVNSSKLMDVMGEHNKDELDLKDELHKLAKQLENLQEAINTTNNEVE